MAKVVIIGGGASGMMAGIFASQNNNEVEILEKNEKLGKKIYITGKGRCNLTNDTVPNEFFSNVVRNPKFLYSSIYSFSPQDTMKFFENNGLTLKTERGNRVFPLSDKASDVTKTLEKSLKSLGVVIKLNTEVKSIIVRDKTVVGVKTETEEIFCDKVIVCTGGVSYPLTGSTGDGIRFAKELGHKIVELKPSLTGIELSGNEFNSLQGLSLKNVSITALIGEKVLYSDFGEMLFTHFGVSGPIILSCSSVINRQNLKDITLSIDLKPALDEKTLDNRLLREFNDNKNKNFSLVLRSLVPSTLIDLICKRTNIFKNKKCCEITKEERKNLIYVLKNFDFKIKALRPIEEAIVCSGGVSVNDINPKTMESKIVKGLYFAGEIIDVDCFTGGFNLQVAFSTGATAGKSV